MTDEVSQEIIKKTQKTLGKYVKKPQLTDKLLKKPPFRFLHDVIRTVIKETGFLRGLYTEDELVSDNVKDKDAKIAFLNKLIEATKTLSKSNLPVRASKIVAGLEPTNTNLLLQALAKSIDSKADSTGYVSQLKSSPKEKQKKTNIPTKTAKKATKNDDKSSNKTVETPKSNPDTPKPKAKPSNKETDQYTKGRRARETTAKDSPKAEEPAQNEPVPKKDNRTIESQINEPTETDQTPTEDIKPANETAEQPPKPLPRPTSARPKSALRPDPIEPTEKAKESVRPARPKSSLRPPSVRPSSARPGAPRLRADSALPAQQPLAMGAINVIVDEPDDGEDDAQVVAVEAAPFEPPPDADLDNKGHLVEQILEQIEDKKRTEIDWDSEVVRSKDGLKEVSQLAELVQAVTKTAQPLGKLVNYVHEDVESMQVELQAWIAVKRRLYGEIGGRRRASSEADRPLLVQLDGLDGDIEKLRREITLINGNILRNDARIRELLSK